ncbi:MAG TPA: histidine phosphatase family protein [Acidimicrobiales bacterium]|nr:histidine phosphatase family protein [Acidimicrobiales bacterium]
MILLVRHGRTEANARGLLLGRMDPQLDAEGRRQAACLGAELAGLDVTRIVTSPLARTRATAEVVADVLRGEGPAVDVEVDERWIELDYGVLDGTPLAAVGADRWSAWRSDVSWAPEGGESLAGLGERVRGACQELAAEVGERDVVVVTHVSPIKAAVAWALGVGDEVAWRMWVAPASVTRIGHGAGGVPSLRSFNEIAHLA